MSLDVRREVLRLLREDEEFRYAVAGVIGLQEIVKRTEMFEERLVRLDEEMVKLREDMNRGFVKLREDMNRGFELMERRTSALGARWGLMTEEAFREGIRGLLGKEMGLTVARWIGRDEGLVYGYPATVEIDLAVKDGKTILIEVKSHVRASDVAAFARKTALYEKATKVKPERLLMITPYAEEEALQASKQLGIEIYTKL